MSALHSSSALAVNFLDYWTDREKEIVRMFASGMSHTQIAEARGNKVVTVRNSIYRIQEKLGADTKQEILVWAARNGLLDDEPGGLPCLAAVSERRRLPKSRQHETHSRRRMCLAPADGFLRVAADRSRQETYAHRLPYGRAFRLQAKHRQ